MGQGLRRKGLAWTKLNQDGSSSSSYEKFLKEEEAAGVRSALEAENGDLLFLVASDKPQVVFDTLGAAVRVRQADGNH